MTMAARIPDFTIRSVSSTELKASAVGLLSFQPGFWEGPGANLDNATVTFLAAFSGKRMLGYLGVRDVTRGELTEETAGALRELIAEERRHAKIGANVISAIETEHARETDVVARNLAFALVAERGQGVGTALFRAALSLAGRDASPEQPIPVYLSVANGNPSASLYDRLGFQPLSLHGRLLTRQTPYRLPPSASGEFGPAITTAHTLMGLVLTGSSPPV